MWKSKLPNGIKEMLLKYENKSEPFLLPYTFILTIESVKYIFTIPNKSVESTTLEDLAIYFTACGINDELVQEFQSCRKLRNNLAHNLIQVEQTLNYLELIEEFIAVLNSVIGDICSQMDKLGYNSLNTSRIF